MTDRRRSHRSPIDCRIRLLSAMTPSQILQGCLLDASASGLRLALTDPIAVGETLLIEARRGNRVVCNVTVRVVRAEAENAGSFRIGCESVSDLSLRQLSQLKSAAAEAATIATA